MTFEEILDQSVAMLQRRGRLTYRTLRRQFDLDDEALADLKDELLFSHPVVDEGGRGLVWTGEKREVPRPASQPAQPEPQPVVEQVQPVQETSSSVEPHAPEAERRQLTVMFCDLVGSTSLSGEFDPEDYRAVVRQYQQVCSEVIQRYDGHIAQYLGDGLLVYFGFPQAHEDDAQRAIHSGLGIIKAIDDLNIRLEQNKGVKLAIRIGIHTGLVVVGEMGGEGRQEQLALGETPNVAARFQGIAQPDTVVISADTYRLVQGYFDCDILGEHDLRGVAQPIAVYRVLGDTGIQSRLDVASTRGLTPLVGRESEVMLLLERWTQVKGGQGQVVLLSGEAGIGKSRLVQVLKDHVAEQPHIRLECRSLPYFTNSALYPITDMVQRTLRFQTEDTPEQKVEKLEHNLSSYRLPLEETVPLFGALLSLPVPEDRYPPLNLTPQRQRQKTLESIVAIILELAEQQPVLFILEDLHWTDPTTLEFIELLIDQTPTASLCVLLTCRPEFQPSWSHRSYLTEMTLNRLSQNQVERMAQQVVDGKRLPTEVIQQLVDKTDGVPLYVEEMTKAVLESGVLKETNGHYELAASIASLTIPATLQDSLMARLDRLETAKAVAQYAAVIGRQFSYKLLQAVSGLDEATLQRELGRLVEAELVYQRGVLPNTTYLFKHALVQDTAYESLLRSTRQGYHHRIAEVLEERFPETAETQPELLAYHFTTSGRNEQAVPYWQRAGQHASDRSANLEAISHCTTGIELLKTLPETPEHTQQSLTLHITLGVSLLMTKGPAAPEVEHAYTQARILCEQVGETPDLAPVLLGLWRFYLARPQLHMARDIGEMLLRLAQRTNDPTIAVTAHYTLGATWMWLGALPTARQHLKEGIALYTPDQRHARVFRIGQDPGVACCALTAQTLWLLGYPDQALVCLHQALVLAHELSHPYSLAFTQVWAAIVFHLRRDILGVHEQAEATVALSTEQGFALWAAWGTSFRGLVLAIQGQGEAGMAQVRQGIASWRATGAALGVPYFFTLLAEVAAHLGHMEDSLQALTEAHTLVERQEERWWEAEIYRLRGVLLLKHLGMQQEEVEACFQQALDLARHQQAKSLELRAATSLARLWHSQGKRQEAYGLLAPVYNWFTEGFDTADLQEAKQLLDELAA
jgi:TOMM system kinase/cyclase fusion protein